jgi:hypothetical protein
VERFLAIVPSAWGLDGARTALAKAKGRRALAQGRPIEARQLALLGGVGPEHIRNLMAKGAKHRLERSKSHPGRVKAASALEWLQTRPGFVTSGW